jgi:hypothetical protein
VGASAPVQAPQMSSHCLQRDPKCCGNFFVGSARRYQLKNLRFSLSEVTADRWLNVCADISLCSRHESRRSASVCLIALILERQQGPSVICVGCPSGLRKRPYARHDCRSIFFIFLRLLSDGCLHCGPGQWLRDPRGRLPPFDQRLQDVLKVPPTSQSGAFEQA